MLPAIDPAWGVAVCVVPSGVARRQLYHPDCGGLAGGALFYAELISFPSIVAASFRPIAGACVKCNEACGVLRSI